MSGADALINLSSVAISSATKFAETNGQTSVANMLQSIGWAADGMSKAAQDHPEYAVAGVVVGIGVAMAALPLTTSTIAAATAYFSLSGAELAAFEFGASMSFDYYIQNGISSITKNALTLIEDILGTTDISGYFSAYGDSELESAQIQLQQTNALTSSAGSALNNVGESLYNYMISIGSTLSGIYTTQNSDGTESINIDGVNSGKFNNISTTIDGQGRVTIGRLEQIDGTSATEDSASGLNQINNWTGPDGTGSLSSVTAFTGATVSANNAVIYIANGSAVTVLGSGNTIYTSGGDDVYVSGGGNTINANGAGDKIAVGNTFGNMDTINASGDTSGSWAADGQQAGIYISDGTQANITGWNDFVVAGNAVNVNLIGGDNSMSIGSNALAGISGTAGSPDSIYSNGNGAGGLTAMGNAAGLWLSDGAQANLSGGDNRVWVNNYATLNADGANNAIVMGTNALVGISGTQGFADTVTSNWNTTGGFTALNQAAGIWVGDGAQANLEGGNNQLWAGNYATLNANGPSNIVSMGMNDLFGANGTNGGYDTVYANWDTSGGFTALGQSAGVWVGSGAQVNLNGSNDQLWQNSFANLNAAGANNVISMGNNALLGLSGTAGGYDTVQANWDTVGGMTSMGNPAGIWLAPSAQANINGEHNQVWANGSDSANVFGAANRINATAGDRIWLSQTGSNADAVFSNSANFQSSTGDGLPSGIYLDGATYAVLNGNSNGLRLSNNDYLAIFGSGNNVVGGIANALSVYGNYNTSSLSSSIENIYDGSYNNFTGSTVQFGNDGGYNYYNGTLYGNRVDNYDDGDDPSQLFEWAQYADEPWEDGEGDGTFTLDAVERENLAGLASGEDRLEKLALGNGQRSEADASAMQPIASVPPQPLASDTQSARLIEAMAAFSPSSTSSATFPVSTDDVAHPVQLAAAHP